MNLAPGEGWPAGRKPTVPRGFAIQALATNLAHPRQVYVLPNGDILAVQAKGPPPEPLIRPKGPIYSMVKGRASTNAAGPKAESKISLIRDANGDGRPELVKDLVTGLKSPFGVAYVDSGLYVANTDGIVRFPFTPGATSLSGPGRLLTPLPAGPINHHWTKSLVASPDGRLLYATVGSNSNIVENGLDAERDRAAIWEIDRLSGRYRIYASGLRNPNSPRFQPGTNRLWVVVNERDELGPHLVPDYLTSVREGGFYGWPWSYFGQNVDRRVKPGRPDMVARAIKPDYALGSHPAALGLTFDEGSSLPAPYRGGVFIGEHGSWNRYRPFGYKVVFVRFENGRPVGDPLDVVTGFLSPDGGSWGRPVGVAIDRTGALLVADDIGNTVWRVSAVPRARSLTGASPAG